MKKVLCLICITVICLLCFTGCFIEQTKTVYDTLNTLIAKDVAKLTLTLKTTTNQDTLTGTYNVTKSNDIYTVTYSYEKLNGYEEVDGVIVPPSEYKSTVQGTMKVKNGTVIQQDGENVNINVNVLNVNGLSFQESYFANVSDQAGLFKADVINVKGLMGYAVDALNMKVEVGYSSSNISHIRITYLSNSSSVELLYVLA